jgi:hypothetical protein
MVDLRKLANVTVYNPCDAMSMTGPDMDVDRALELWGNDLVHPATATAPPPTNFKRGFKGRGRAMRERVMATLLKPLTPVTPMFSQSFLTYMLFFLNLSKDLERFRFRKVA